jgi:hypothetical protein
MSQLSNTQIHTKYITMESFTEQLKASALQAARVAQNLATTGFDEMAASDEYVQSEGYNHHHQPGVRKPPSSTATTTTTTTTTTAATTLLSIATKSKQQDQQQQQLPPKPLITTQPSIVQDYGDSTYLLSNSEDEDDDDDDPIRSILRSKKESGHSFKEERRKETNRFIDDLECRLSMPEQPGYPPIPHSCTSNSTSPPSIADGTIAISAWLSTAATSIGIPSKLIATTKKGTPHSNAMHTSTMAPLARHNNNNNKRPQTVQHNMNDIMIGNVALISSTAMLGESEKQQLEQLRLLEQQSTPFGPIRLLYETIVVHHHREVFIVLTLVLCALVYFHVINF